MRTILWNKQNIIPGLFMFAINAFGLPIVFGIANLIDLFGRNWEIYKTRATDQKARKIWQKELRKYLICFPFYLVVPFEKSFLFPEEEEGLSAYSRDAVISVNYGYRY